jgi:thioredoxin reductase (NADPH)
MNFFSSFNPNEKTGQKQTTELPVEKVKCLIIGSGPAGLTAAIYAARANLSPVLYEGLQPGGQLTTTTEVENFPGYPEGVTGTVLMEDIKKQAMRFGADIRFGMATKADFAGPVRKVWIDDEKIMEAEVVIIATGATAKYLGLPSEEKYKGQGVSACATCDGFFYRGQDVAVVGGGDTACEEATYLSGICRKVYLIVRKDYLRASKAMQQKVVNTKNIEVLFEHQIKEIVGNENGVNGVLLSDKNGQEKKTDVSGFFVAIGHHPNAEMFKPFIETDETGYIITKTGTTQTNVPGIFACGDVQDKHFRQAITAAGSGCMAAIEAERYLSNK